MQAWYWENTYGTYPKVYQRPGATYPYGAVYEELGNGCYTAIIRRYPELPVLLGRFPTSAEAEAVVEAVMPIYCMEGGMNERVLLGT